jgi:predicted RNA-binding protein with PIN domain
MSLHFILDGYNVIKNSEIFFPHKLKDQRSALIKFIQEKRPCGSLNNKVSIIFDAKKAELNFFEQKALNKKPNMEVIFTNNESADEKIKTMVDNSHNPRKIIVVSDDRDIQFFIKACGAYSMSSEEFINKANLKGKAIKAPYAMELNHSQAAKINQELKKIWLKDGN